VQEALALADAVPKASRFIGVCMLTGLPMLDVFPVMRKTKAVKRRFDRWQQKIVDKRRDLMASGAKDVPQDALSAMIRNGFDDNRILDHLTTFVAAGQDTSSFFLSYTLYLLSLNKVRARATPAAAIGGNGNVCSRRSAGCARQGQGRDPASAWR